MFLEDGFVEGVEMDCGRRGSAGRTLEQFNLRADVFEGRSCQCQFFFCHMSEVVVASWLKCEWMSQGGNLPRLRRPT